MSFIKSKHRIIFFSIFLCFLSNCNLKEPSKTHGINYLDNRYKSLIVNKTNTNDVIKILGYPHSKSLKNEKQWIYFERTLTKGKLYKLGQNIMKENNIIVLGFNNRGVLINKKITDKRSMKKVKFSKDTTINTVEKTSFINSFLQSLRQKMYSNKKF